MARIKAAPSAEAQIAADPSVMVRIEATALVEDRTATVASAMARITVDPSA